MSRSCFTELHLEVETILQERRACSRPSSRPVTHLHEHRSLTLDCGRGAHRNKHAHHKHFGHGFWKKSVVRVVHVCAGAALTRGLERWNKARFFQKTPQSSLSPRWLADTAQDCRRSLLPSEVVSSSFASAYKAGRKQAGKWGLLWSETGMENAEGEARDLSA